MNHKNENQSEVAIKMNHFQKAVENGELDHLNNDLSVIMRLEKQLLRLADTALQHDSRYNKELQQFQSVIGMVHTLIHEGRLKEVYDTLKKSYPEYYLTDSEQFQTA